MVVAGALTFADGARLEQGLDAYFATEPDTWLLIDLDEIKRDGLTLAIDHDEEAHRDYRAPTLRKLAALAHYAASGSLTSGYDTIAAGNAPSDPSRPRHYRYDAYYAADSGDAARLRELVALGAKLDGRYHISGWTLLHFAARRETADAVRVLIEAGLDVNTPKPWPPLYSSCRVAVTRALLAAGADPNALVRDPSGDTKALLTKQIGFEGVAEALLAAGAIPRPADYAELARRCAYYGSASLLRELVALAPAMQSLIAAPEVVAEAIKSRNPAMLDYVLEQGGELPDDFLQQAIQCSAVALVETALRAPDALARCGPSNRPTDAMCVAARFGRIPFMEMLAAHGVPLHPATPGATNPQIEAAGAGHEAVLAWLLERGAPFDPTAARHAANPDIAMFYIERGCDHDEIGMKHWSDDEEYSYYARLEAHRSK